VYAAGDEERLSDLASALHTGPQMASVRAVEEQDAAVEKLPGFVIR
jgi:acylphosphatase